MLENVDHNEYASKLHTQFVLELNHKDTYKGSKLHAQQEGENVHPH